MSEDNLYLLFCFLTFGLTLAVLTIRSKNRLKTVSINLIVAGLYSGLFLYNLTYNSLGGSGLAWLVYLMFSIGLHWLINFIGIILTFTKKSKASYNRQDSLYIFIDDAFADRIEDAMEIIHNCKVDKYKVIVKNEFFKLPYPDQK